MNEILFWGLFWLVIIVGIGVCFKFLSFLPKEIKGEKDENIG